MAEQTEIAYEGKEWKSYQTGGTLIRATDLNNMERGISDACNGVDELRTKRLPTYVVAQDGDTATQDVYAEPILGQCLILDLATRTTYYETGGDEDGHRKAITSGDDIDDLRDSLSQLEDSGWVDAPHGARYRRKNGVLYIEFKGDTVDAGDQLLFTLPEGFRPDRNQDAFPAAVVSESSVGRGYVGVYRSGEVRSNFAKAGYLWTAVTLVL